MFEKKKSMKLFSYFYWQSFILFFFNIPKRKFNSLHQVMLRRRTPSTLSFSAMIVNSRNLAPLYPILVKQKSSSEKMSMYGNKLVKMSMYGNKLVQYVQFFLVCALESPVKCTNLETEKKDLGANVITCVCFVFCISDD